MTNFRHGGLRMLITHDERGACTKIALKSCRGRVLPHAHGHKASPVIFDTGLKRVIMVLPFLCCPVQGWNGAATEHPGYLLLENRYSDAQWRARPARFHVEPRSPRRRPRQARLAALFIAGWGHCHFPTALETRLPAALQRKPRLRCPWQCHKSGLGPGVADPAGLLVLGRCAPDYAPCRGQTATVRKSEGTLRTGTALQQPTSPCSYKIAAKAP